MGIQVIGSAGGAGVNTMMDYKQRFIYLGGIAKSETVQMHLEIGSFDYSVINAACSLVSIILKSSANRTAGTLSAKITKNGSPIAETDLDIQLDGSNINNAKKTINEDIITFAEGDKLGVQISGDADWEPNDSDIDVEVYWNID